MKPNLFIVGAPKASTTSLYHYLSTHQDIFMAIPKEINYFSKDDINKQELYYNSFTVDSIEEYENLFKNKNNAKIVGEASVSYLFYEKVANKIFRYNPNAKIIILLRNPIERAFSHYLMDKRLGYIKVPFEEIIFKSSKVQFSELFYQQYIELGFYYQQVKRYLNTFGKNQVKIFLTDDIIDDISKVLSSIKYFFEYSNWEQSKYQEEI